MVWRRESASADRIRIDSGLRRNEIWKGSHAVLHEVASTETFGDPHRMNAPGLFYYLVKESVMTLDVLAPLLTVLPPESFVSTNLRDGEAYDSKRWPVANDAAIASIAARCLDTPAVHQALQEIEFAVRDRSKLRTLARKSTAQALASAGGNADLLFLIWPDATPSDLAFFSEPALPLEMADAIQSLCYAHYNAADGLYAYHVHRGIPGPSAEPAARIVKQAIETGKLHVDEVVSIAVALVTQGSGASERER